MVNTPLSRRLVSRYLAFGLAGLLLCVTTSLTLAFRDSLEAFVSLVALGPALILLIGAVVLYRTSALNSLIEQELQRVSQNAADPQRLTGSDPVVQGWNAILERLGNQEVWSNLEDRLSHAVGDLNQGRISKAFHQLPVPVAVTENSGQIMLANQAFEALARGLGTTEVKGSDLLEVLKTGEAANADKIAEKLENQKGSVSVEVRKGDTPDAGVLQITRRSLTDNGDGTAQEIWIVRDITQQLLADEMRNQFVATATHELRTPLSNIKAYAETLSLQEDLDVEMQKEFCNIINAEATRLSRFVDELLNISQMEAGSLTLHRHETDLLRLFGEVIENVKPELDGKEITLEVALPAKLAKFRLDKDKFSSALVNLLGNAAKYTPTGGRVLFGVDHKADAIEIHVEDSGIGIAEDELPRIFEKFFRSQDERLREITGNGLGLAFTHEVIRLHGGKIDVQSELNKGTRFTVTIPT